MLHYRLTKFLNKHKVVQASFLVFVFLIISAYIFSFSLEALSVVITASHNSDLIEDDNELIEVTNYELENTKLTLNEKEYEDIDIYFYGITTDDKTTYFKDSSNTLIMSLPPNFGVSFFVSSSAFVVLISLILIVIALWIVNSSERLNLVCITKSICIGASVLLGLFVIIMFAIFLIFY